jgi:hypothetical protein
MGNETPTVAKGPTWVDVNFEVGFIRADQAITKIRIRKPKGGDLRGLSLKDLMQAEVDAIITVLPRISDPIMTVQDAAALEAQDLAEAGGTISSFFYTSAQKAMMLGETATS